MDRLIRLHILWEYWVVVILMILSVISSLLSLINIINLYFYYSVKVPSLNFIDLFGMGEVIVHLNSVIMIALFFWLRKLKKRLEV